MALSQLAVRLQGCLVVQVDCCAHEKDSGIFHHVLDQDAFDLHQVGNTMLSGSAKPFVLSEHFQECGMWCSSFCESNQATCADEPKT